MKNQALCVTAMLGLLFALQRIGYADFTARIKLYVPFDFFVGKAKLSAGQYFVERHGQDILWISSTDGRVGVITMIRNARKGKGPPKNKIVFHQYGMAYFLSQFWEESRAVPYRLPKSCAERKLARKKPVFRVVTINAE